MKGINHYRFIKTQMYIVATDFDGTLNRGGVSAADREAIERFRNAGNLFGIVTGRDYYMYKTLEELKLEVDFIIVLNGAMIVSSNGEIIREVRAEGNVLRGIIEYLGEHTTHDLSCLVGLDRYNFNANLPDGDERHPPLSKADEIGIFTHLNTVCVNDDDATLCTAEINRRFGNTINALQNGRCIDIPPRGIDKGEGVAIYADMVGVPHENIWCAGDNMNDMAMIERFHGCAVPNAREEVKNAAERVYDGIYEIIDTIMSLD